ncbi:MAG: rubrerythrin family protein [Clostridiales bacterium]|jgi:rubrerythrin|nr:rubrerythrin family protein [Clostridiales bacterium]
MAAELKGKKTEADLMAAYAAECMSAVKYGFYADRAAAEGHAALEELFRAAAKNERAHAGVWFRVLTGGVKDTGANLRDAVKGEGYESGEMYARFCREAETEGFLDIARLFSDIAAVETAHAAAFKEAENALTQNRLYEDDAPARWRCGSCGCQKTAELAPDGCPVCGAGLGQFKKL